VALFGATLFYLSLFPYDFDFSRRVPAPRLDWPRTDGDWVDSVLNVLAYIPLGLLAYRACRFWSAILLGALLSATIEVAQSFLPIRHPSVRDLVLNTAGIAIGHAAGRWVTVQSAGQLSGIRNLLRSKLALLAWSLWFIWQAAPFLPHMRRAQLAILGQALLHPALSLERVFDQAFCLVFLAKISPIPHRNSWLLALFGILASAFVYRTRFEYSDLLGLTLGIALAFLSWRSLAIAGFAWLCWKQFHAIGATIDPEQRFSWLPLAGFAAAPFQVLHTTAGKALLYGATVFAAIQAGARPLPGASVAVLLLALGEFAQLAIPGRTPEITDPLLCAATSWLFLQLARPSAQNSSPPAAVPVETRLPLRP